MELKEKNSSLIKLKSITKYIVQTVTSFINNSISITISLSFFNNCYFLNYSSVHKNFNTKKIIIGADSYKSRFGNNMRFLCELRVGEFDDHKRWV